MSGQLHIMSTRSLHSNAMKRLQDCGWKITVHDFISKQTELPVHITSGAIHKNIVLTSQNGVDAFLRLTEKLQLSADDYIAHCIAEATKRAAIHAGLFVKTTAPNAMFLAEEILKLQDIKSVTHICSNRRLGELFEKLNSAGVEVQEVVSYKTELTPISIEHTFDALLFFSPSAVDSFLSANDLKQVPCFCIGKTTGDYTKQKGFTETYIPGAPSEEALVNLVIEHFTSTSIHVNE